MHKTIYTQIKSIASRWTLISNHETKETEIVLNEENTSSCSSSSSSSSTSTSTSTSTPTSSTFSENLLRTARSIRKPLMSLELKTTHTHHPHPTTIKETPSEINLPFNMHLSNKNVVLPWCSYSHETSIFSKPVSKVHFPSSSFSSSSITSFFHSPSSGSSSSSSSLSSASSRFNSTSISSFLFPFVPFLLKKAKQVIATTTTSSSSSPLPPWLSSSLPSPTSSLPPAFNKVCILGIHGWFPLKFFQKVVGEPTGTSTKFCEQMKSALQSWTKQHYHTSLLHSNIITIPLEYEGKVDVRVEKLYEQIMNPHFYVPEGNVSSFENKSYWQSQLETCQTIFVATHSQGCPTSMFLMAKLIENGIIDPKRQNLVILSQAGICHGPFPAQRTHLIVKYLEADAARELFDFNSSTSEISKRYYEACEKVLGHGGKLVLVSSWLDQVVPLYSSAFYALTHPNIFRAVFIDKDNFAFDDFLSHLVIFALKLRNSGISDHGLLVYLSDVVAGSLYFGSGHSTLYEEASVYELAINFLFTTKHPEDFPLAPIPRNPLSVWFTPKKPKSHFVLKPFEAPIRLNPYYLPWIMHCLVSDPKISGNESLSNDLHRLVELYKDWNVGGSRVRKELKYKLEPFYKASL